MIIKPIIQELFAYASVLFPRIVDSWEKDNWIFNLLRILLAWLLSIWVDISVYVGIVMFLSVYDVYTGLRRALKQGEGFSSKKMKRGLIERLLLFSSLLLVMLALDNMIRELYDYGAYYITNFVAVMIGFYEAGSIIENLIVLHPKFKFLNRLAKVLNLLEKRYEQRTIDGVDKVLEEFERKNESD